MSNSDGTAEVGALRVGCPPPKKNIFGRACVHIHVESKDLQGGRCREAAFSPSGPGANLVRYILDSLPKGSAKSAKT